MVNRISSFRAFREMDLSYKMLFDMDTLVCVDPCCDDPDCFGCSARLKNAYLRYYHSECANKTLFPKMFDSSVLLSHFFLICKNFAHSVDYGEPRCMFKRWRSDDNRVYPDWFYSYGHHDYTLYNELPGA